MGDNQLPQHEKTSTLLKFITNISNIKHQRSTNQDLRLNGDHDQLTIILNGETILPHPPSLSFSSIGNNMTTNTSTAIGDGIVKTVPNDNNPHPR